MKMDTLRVFTRHGFLVLCLGLSVALSCSTIASATTLPIGDEVDSWSDLVIPGTTVDYDSATDQLTISATNSGGQLEIGGEFGPGNPGTHYGTGGTLNGVGPGTLLFTSLSLSAEVDASGAVTDPGTVTITYANPPAGVAGPGSFSDDYGIDIGAVLLEGTVADVLFDVAGQGSSNLDVLFNITGGILQDAVTSEPSLNGVPFSPVDLGLIRLTSSNFVGQDWTTSFNTSATNDVLGIPEPGTISLALMALAFVTLGRKNNI